MVVDAKFVAKLTRTIRKKYHRDPSGPGYAQTTTIDMMHMSSRSFWPSIHGQRVCEYRATMILRISWQGRSRSVVKASSSFLQGSLLIYVVLLLDISP